MKTMNLEFRKIIIPVVLGILLLGVVFGIASYTKKGDKKETQEQSQQSEESLFTNLEPSKDQNTDQTSIEVKGKTKSKRNTVVINGEKVKVNKNSEFSTSVSLNEGQNEILVEVTTPNNKKDSKRLVITRKAGDGSATEEQKQTETPAQPQGNGQGQPGQPGTQAPGTTTPTPDGTPVPQTGELSKTGPKENAALAISAIVLALLYWQRSKRDLKLKA